jgi:putative toxin-antitoxin system antitoxin component (TIGR02293 family)
MTADSSSAPAPHGSDGQAAGRDRPRLGEILVAGGAITAAQLEHALAEQSSFHLPLGQTLLKLGYTTDETMRQALSSQLGVPYIDLQNVIIDRTLATLIDREFARRHALFPVARIGRTLTIAMDDPTATGVVEELARVTDHAVTVVTSSAEAIQRALGRLYERPPASVQAPAAWADRGADVTARHTEPAAARATPLALGSGGHGYVALLGLMTFELPELLRSIEGGLPYRVFDAFVEQTGFPAERVAEFADIPRRTLHDRRDEGRFTRDESDRLVRAARIFGGAVALFGGDRATASAWLMSGQPALGGSIPIELARTDLGAREVEAALASLTSRRA